VPIVEPMLQQRCERHDRELPYRATGGRDADNASRAASAG